MTNNDYTYLLEGLTHNDLLHVYDPAKAHEYYERNKKLKGRKAGSVEPPKSKGGRLGSSSGEDIPKPAKPGKEAREAAEARVAALQKRFDRLKDELAKLVEAAKIRSGVDPADAKSDKKTPKSEKDDSKPEKKATAKEKREAADRSKEYREKNPPKKTSLANKEEALQKQIKEIRQQIQDAITKARSQASLKSQTAPKGR